MANYIWTVVNGVPYNPGTTDFATDQSGTTWRVTYRDPVSGAITYPMTVDDTGRLITLGSVNAGVSVTAASTGTIGFTSRFLAQSPADGQAVLTNAALSAGIGFDVTTDATLKVRTRAQTADAHVSAASVRGNAVAYASLPATPVEGMLVGVTDSNTATWGDTVAAGGANHILAYYNGTNWTVAGK